MNCGIVVQRIVIEPGHEEDDEGKGHNVYRFAVVLALQAPNGTLFPFSEEPLVVDDNELPEKLGATLVDYVSQKLRPLVGGSSAPSVGLELSEKDTGSFLLEG